MILVTGATGYTGPFVVEALIGAGLRVRALVRSEARAQIVLRMGAETVPGDLEDERSLLDALEGVDTLVAVSHIRYARALVRACATRGVTRGIFFSSTRRSSKVASQTVREVVDGEAGVLESGLDYTLLRPTMIYGPGDDRNISRIRRHVETHRFLPVFGSGERAQQPVFVLDVAEAVPQVIRRTATIRKTYTLAGPRAMSYLGIVDSIAAASSRWVVKVYLPIRATAGVVAVYERFARVPRITAEQVRRFEEDKAFDIGEARQDFGFSPVPFEQGLRLAADLGASGTGAGNASPLPLA